MVDEPGRHDRVLRRSLVAAFLAFAVTAAGTADAAVSSAAAPTRGTATPAPQATTASPRVTTSPFGPIPTSPGIMTASPQVAGPSLPPTAVNSRVFPAPAVKLSSEYVDGCDHHYGLPTQCVPVNFPPGTRNRCQWLRQHGLSSIPVSKRDQLKIDTNKDGVACGPGDA